MTRLRGHHLLCLQGFRGLGYDDASVARLRQLFERVVAHPDAPIRVVDGPDEVCEACPHLAGGACVRTPGAEVAVRAHDRRVLDALGLAPGDVTSIADVRRRMADPAVRAAALASCQGCPWVAVCGVTSSRAS